MKLYGTVLGLLAALAIGNTAKADLIFGVAPITNTPGASGSIVMTVSTTTPHVPPSPFAGNELFTIDVGTLMVSPTGGSGGLITVTTDTSAEGLTVAPGAPGFNNIVIGTYSISALAGGGLSESISINFDTSGASNGSATGAVSLSSSITAVPEPSTLGLVSLVGLGIARVRRRRS